MKPEIHPKYQQVNVHCACGETCTTGSTKKELRVEICSKCHPFFTGKQKLVDTAGRIDRFQQQYAKKAGRKKRGEVMSIASGLGRRGEADRRHVRRLHERPHLVDASRTADKNVDMLIGGQAVIEGVMMRSLTGYSVAVRQPDGGVAIRKDKLVSITTKYPFLKFPVLRGSVVLIQSLILGMRALNYSASVATEGKRASRRCRTGRSPARC